MLPTIISDISRALLTMWPWHFFSSVMWSVTYFTDQGQTSTSHLTSGVQWKWCSITLIKHLYFQFSSVQFSHSVVSDSLQPHELQHARPPCPSPTPGVHPNPCLLSWWCHPTISSSVIPFSSCPQSFPASGSFQMSQLFTSGGQSTGVWASASVLPMNT